MKNINQNQKPQTVPAANAPATPHYKFGDIVVANVVTDEEEGTRGMYEAIVLYHNTQKGVVSVVCHDGYMDDVPEKLCGQVNLSKAKKPFTKADYTEARKAFIAERKHFDILEYIYGLFLTKSEEDFINGAKHIPQSFFFYVIKARKFDKGFRETGELSRSTELAEWLYPHIQADVDAGNTFQKEPVVDKKSAAAAKAAKAPVQQDPELESLDDLLGESEGGEEEEDELPLPLDGGSEDDDDNDSFESAQASSLPEHLADINSSLSNHELGLLVLKRLFESEKPAQTQDSEEVVEAAIRATLKLFSMNKTLVSQLLTTHFDITPHKRDTVEDCVDVLVSAIVESLDESAE